MLRVKKLIGFHLSRNQAQSVIFSSQQLHSLYSTRGRAAEEEEIEEGEEVDWTCWVGSEWSMVLDVLIESERTSRDSAGNLTKRLTGDLAPRAAANGAIVTAPDQPSRFLSLVSDRVERM